MGPSAVVKFGVFELDPRTPELSKSGVRLRLPPQAVNVLARLVSRHGQVVTRQELRELLWPDEPYGDHDQGLHKIISQLREVLGDSTTSPLYLETLPRVGYRFLAPVEVVPVPAPADCPAPPTPHPWWRERAWIVVPLVVSLLALLAVALIWRRTPELPVLSPKRLTALTGSELYPAFSPSGENVAFTWDGDNRDNFDIYVMVAASGKIHRITHNPARDYCPIWSPDGRFIAFLRTLSPNRAGVFLMAADGTGERLLTEVASPKEYIDWYSRSLAWTSDPDLLIIRDSIVRGGPYSLYSYSVKSGARRVITAPPVSSEGDDNPAVSPDGKQLAFTRRSTGLRAELHLVALSGNPDPTLQARQITFLNSHIESPAWNPEGGDIVFAAAPPTAWLPRLLKVHLASGGVSDIGAARVEGLHPAFQPGGGPLIFVRRSIEETSIWRAAVPLSGKTWAPSRLLASTEGGLTYPNPSPDGKLIAFRSLRSGAPEVWIAEADGSNPRQLTHVGGNGAQAPRWSPDGNGIAFESRAQGPSKIWIADTLSGSTRQLTAGSSDDILPSWSNDGKTLYFASTSSGTYQIWSIPSVGGPPVQVTRNGGSCAMEAPRLQAIFYTAGGYPAALRKTTIQAREETEVVAGLPGVCSFAVLPEGVFYLSAPGINGSDTSLRFLPFQAGAVPRPIPLPADVHRFLSSSADGRFLYYSQTDRRESDLMLIDKLF